MKRSFQIAYLAVGALTVLEFLFVRGMFTWLIMTIAVAAAGARQHPAGVPGPGISGGAAISSLQCGADYGIPVFGLSG